jgi:IS605 OrfB family transposase
LDKLSLFIDEYKRLCQYFVDTLWDMDKIPRLIPKDITEKAKVQTWLSARAIQACAKQASGIVRGTKQKNKQRNYVLGKLKEQGKFKKARQLAKVIEKNPMTKPTLEEVNPELDSRFVSITLDGKMDGKTTYEGWITLSSLGNKLKLALPFKKTKHLNQLSQDGELKQGIRLSNNKAILNFEMPDPLPKTEGTTIGIDIGQKNIFTCSDGQINKDDIHGWNLDKINDKVSRRKKGSKGFARAVEHRKNHIGWSVNQLNLNQVKKVRLENIKNLRKGNKSSRKLSHWTYTEIFGKLEDACIRRGVQVEKVNPTYTSQRCSQCGWVRKANRKGKQFKCKACGYASDSDLNASLNLSLDLPPISRKKRLSGKNRLGFYWNQVSQEPIVPGAHQE